MDQLVLIQSKTMSKSYDYDIDEYHLSMYLILIPPINASFNLNWRKLDELSSILAKVQ